MEVAIVRFIVLRPIIHRKKMQARYRMWVHPINARRDTYGAFAHLLPDLYETFVKLSDLVRDQIVKENTHYRQAIQPERNRCGKYVVTLQLVTDNARYFQSTCFKDTCFKWNVKYFILSPYFHKGNQVKCFDKNLKACLTIFYKQGHTRWDRDLDFINIGFNSAVHNSTGSPPSLPLLGCPLSHPFPLLDGVTEHLLDATYDAAACLDEGRVAPPFVVGDPVLCKDFVSADSGRDIGSKFIPKFVDPFRISKFLNYNMAMLCPEGLPA
ncbi:hypothetical protein PR048_018577, partial [Dryococelus australis]